nr:MAG TPA: hypothetical protein [Caudoviricetes sp.]
MIIKKLLIFFGTLLVRYLIKTTSKLVNIPIC